MAFQASAWSGDQIALEASAFGTSDHPSDRDSAAAMHIDVRLGHEPAQVVGAVQALKMVCDGDYSG